MLELPRRIHGGVATDHVKTDRAGPAPMLAQPGGCAASKPRLFARINRFMGRARPLGATRLDLDEHDLCSADHHEIDLYALRTGVSGEHAVAALLEIRRCVGLAAPTEFDR